MQVPGVAREGLPVACVPPIAGGAVFCGPTAGTLRAALVAVAVSPAFVPVTRQEMMQGASAAVRVYVPPVARDHVAVAQPLERERRVVRPCARVAGDGLAGLDRARDLRRAGHGRSVPITRSRAPNAGPAGYRRRTS